MSQLPAPYKTSEEDSTRSIQIVKQRNVIEGAKECLSEPTVQPCFRDESGIAEDEERSNLDKGKPTSEDDGNDAQLASAVALSFTIPSALVDQDRIMRHTTDSPVRAKEHDNMIQSRDGAINKESVNTSESNVQSNAKDSVARDLMDDGYAKDMKSMTDAADLLIIRFEEHGRVEDLEQAITIQERVVSCMRINDTDRPVYLDSLGILLAYRFELQGKKEDIERAISVQQQAVDLSPNSDAEKVGRWNNLGSFFVCRFKQLKELGDIENAISAQRRAIALIPHGHTDKPKFLTILGNSFWCRFEQLGKLEDIDDAISALQQAVALTPPSHIEKPRRLNILGNSLRCRFDQQGVLKDIEDAILVLQHAINLTPKGHASMPGYLNNLGNSFLSQFEKLGEIGNISDAVSFLQQAVKMTPDGHADKPGRLTNLGNSLRCRFERMGELEDIDNAISVQQKAITLNSHGDIKKAIYLTNLGSSLFRRFGQLGDLADIDNAISVQQQAVTLTPEGHANKPGRFNNLGSSFSSRFRKLGERVDIDNAILFLQEAVDLTPHDHADKPGHLNNLGNSLRYRFQQLGELVDIDNAIDFQQQAVTLTPPGHAYEPMYLTNLGIFFMCRFEQLGNLADIDNAISVQQQAIRLIPHGLANKPTYLNNLGNSFSCRFEKLGEPIDVENAIASYCHSATSPTGKPTDRFHAAHLWAIFLSATGSSPLPAYTVMINLISQVVWLGQTVHQRYQNISGLDAPINKAVATACQLNMHELAVEWLEQGRSIVWGHILHLRSPVDELSQVNPELATQIQQAGYELENAGSSSVTSSASQQSALGLEAAAQAHRLLATRWEKLLEQARSIPGFGDFLQPKRLSRLKSAVQNQNIVVINVDESRCDALILLPHSIQVQSVHLQNASYNTLNVAHKALLGCLKNADVRERGMRQSFGDFPTSTTFKNILTMLWRDIVKPVLEHLNFIHKQPADSLPHITWCLTGPLSFLPLHAAGDYNGPDPLARTFSYVISSYTPSLNALLESTQRPQHTEICHHGALAITQSDTLPGTLQEVDKLTKLMDGYKFERLDGKMATVSAVSQAMEECGWIHFACHAEQNAQDPTKSAFKLGDGKLELGSIMRKRLPKAELAFLSACQTATGDESLPEEGVHLAAGMLIAGYKSVIGTMWSIKDKDAPQVAEAFYLHLLSSKNAKTSDALHWAIAELREKVGEDDFISWAPFIHVGH